jgi:chromate reductase
VPDVKILGLAGSVRIGSYNKAAVRAARQLIPPNVELNIFELDDSIPAFNQDDEREPPAKIVELKGAIRDADAILFSTPEYNYSVSGVLKNAIDWASRPYGHNSFEGKPCAIMGVSIGSLGTARAQYHLRQMFVFLDMHCINRPEVMIGNAPDRFDAKLNLTDETSRRLIAELMGNLVAWTLQLRPELTPR